jgi:hypothetical protein
MLSMVTLARVAIGGLAGSVLIAAKAGSDYFTAYDEINKAIIRLAILPARQRFRLWLPPSLLLPLLARL